MTDKKEQEQPLTLVVNGSAVTLPVRTLEGLLRHYGLACDTVVAEVNGSIVARDAMSGRALSQGDRVELVRFVGGG